MTITVTVAWALGVAALLAWGLRASTTPGPRLHSPRSAADIPPALGPTPPAGRVIMALHPLCPCSAASIERLAEIARRARPGIDFIVLAAVPDRDDPEWTSSPAGDAVRASPRLRLVLDRGGRLAHALGLATSGHVLAFDRDGLLRFSGGITSLRGHAGDNPAADALAAIVVPHAHHAAHDLVQPPVFGCQLIGCPADASHLAEAQP